MEIKETPVIRNEDSDTENRIIMVFDADGELISIYSSGSEISKLPILINEPIDELCTNKKTSENLGFSYRYLEPSLHLKINDFDMTVTQYDVLCEQNREG